MTEVEQGIVDLSNLVVKLRDENTAQAAEIARLREALAKALYGLSWARAWIRDVSLTEPLAPIDDAREAIAAFFIAKP